MNISRPTLVLNKTICLQNIELMVEKAKRHHLRSRPHFKTHQSIEIGRWFRQSGVRQITVSSVAMARYFASDGWDDITIAIPFNRHEINELNQLLEVASVNLVTDNAETIEFLNQKLHKPAGIFIEISTGYARTGIPSFAIQAIKTTLDAISNNPMLIFKGFLTHSGHAYQARSRNEIQNIQYDTLQKMAQLKKQYLPVFPDLEISVGDTPTCSVSENFQGVDEIRPGNFVFYDLTQYQLGACNIDDIAVRMHCPVISKQASRNEIVIYGGAIHFSKDWLPHYDSKPSYGRIIIRKNNEAQLLGPSSCLSNLSQEHGVIKVNSKEFQQIEIGDIVEVIPIHSCLTAHAMGQYITTKGEVLGMMSH
jgi:D-serine deaminase-like pyridoxal phosphate-dependent protein